MRLRIEGEIAWLQTAKSKNNEIYDYTIKGFEAEIIFRTKTRKHRRPEGKYK